MFFGLDQYAKAARPPNPKEPDMPASSFDFDVVTGPSTPRDDARPQDQSQPQPAETKPAAPRQR